MRLTLFAAAALIVSLATPVVSADALHVTCDEAPSWAAAVAMLQGDLHGEGRVVHVRVTDDSDEPLLCSDYSLALDPVASAAFEVVGCDPGTAATTLRLAHRSALFDEDDVAPRPRLAGISAIQMRTGGERGGARRTGASDVLCTVAVRPYIEDIEHGRRVYLQPGRFVLHPLGAGITAQATGDGWLLSSGGQASITTEYVVIDTRSNEAVVQTRATLACGTQEANSAMRPGDRGDSGTSTSASACPGLTELHPLRDTTGTTLRGTTHPTYVLHVQRSSHVSVDVSGDFDGEADVYAGCGAGRAPESVLRVAPVMGIEQSLRLAAGTYTFAIEDHDRRPHNGGFIIRLRSTDTDPEVHLH